MGRKSAAVRRFWFDRVERGERVEILTTEYTETVEPYLKNTERSSVYSVWERSDLSVYSVVKNCRGWFNSEPNKRLTLTRSLASRGAGTEKLFTFHEK